MDQFTHLNLYFLYKSFPKVFTYGRNQNLYFQNIKSAIVRGLKGDSGSVALLYLRRWIQSERFLQCPFHFYFRATSSQIPGNTLVLVQCSETYTFSSQTKAKYGRRVKKGNCSAVGIINFIKSIYPRPALIVGFD